MVLCNKIIYFFYHNGISIGNYDLSSNLKPSQSYSLIPFKYENNCLHYLISYPININSFELIFFQYNISLNKIDTINHYEFTVDIHNQTINLGDILYYISSVRCLFMSNFSDSDILVCFYALRYCLEIHIRFFDPNKNFIEIEEYFIYCNPFSEKKHSNVLYFEVLTDNERKLAYIFIAEYELYYLKFNISNIFGTEYKCEGNLKITNFFIPNSLVDNKVYYFRQTKEYIFTSKTENNKEIYIVYFNFISGFNKKNESKIMFNLGTANIFSLMILENNYVIVRDVLTTYQIKTFFYNMTELGTIEFVEDPITNYFEGNNGAQNTAITTNPTTVPNTIITALPTTIPTSILANNPTSIITTILTTVPTTILSTIIITVFNIPINTITEASNTVPHSTQTKISITVPTGTITTIFTYKPFTEIISTFINKTESIEVKN